MAFLDTYSRFTNAIRTLPLTLLGRISPASPARTYLTAEKIRSNLAIYGNNIRFLPFVDTVVTETQEMRMAYRDMIKEPAVKAAFLKKVLSVASLDVTVQPASKSPRDKEIADFCKDALQKSKGSTRRITQSILFGGLMDGYSVSEKVWMPATRGKWAGKIRLKILKGKDSNRLLLEGDGFRNVGRIVDQQTGIGYHPDNFVVFTHLPIFEVPTGISDFRSAYRPYWLMDTAWKLRAIGLERYTLPMLKGTYKDAETRPTLENALQEARGQSWMTLPEGAQVEALTLAARGQADFESAIADLRKEIFLAICGAFLQALEGSTPSGRGNSQVHQDTSELLEWMLAAEVADVINDQLIPDLVDLNYDGNPEYPTCNLGAINLDELKAELEIDTGLQGLGLKLSAAETYEKYKRTPPIEESDALVPPPKGGSGSPAGSPAPAFADDDGDVEMFGGPGSGPHPSAAQGSKAAKEASAVASKAVWDRSPNAKELHEKAAQAHEDAAKLHTEAQNKQELYSSKYFHHFRAAGNHQQSANAHASIASSIPAKQAEPAVSADAAFRFGEQWQRYLEG